MIRIGTTLVAIALTVAPAFAQDAQKTALAREMLIAMRAADNLDAVIPTVMTALKPAVTAGNPKAAKDWDELVPIMTQELSSMKEGLVTDMAAIYARRFELGELRSFVDFYKTAAGQKLARLTPELAQETMQAGQKLGQQIAVRVAERMREELRKRGNKI